MSNSNLIELFNQKIVIADGPMGTMINSHHLSESDYKGSRFINHPVNLSDNCDVLNLTQPDLIKQIHSDYLNSGADIICTNTLNSNFIVQEKYQLEKYVTELNQAAVSLARDAINSINRTRLCLVAGVIGPTNKSSSAGLNKTDKPAVQVDPDELYQAFYQQAEALLDAGVDLFLIETIFDLNNGQIALKAIAELLEIKEASLPVWVSATVDQSGCLWSGESAEQFYQAVKPFQPFCVGFNCSVGVDSIIEPLHTISKIADSFISAVPSAGLPQSGHLYPDTTEKIVSQLTSLAEQKIVNLVGGCCGTTPELIKQLSVATKNLPPRHI